MKRGINKTSLYSTFTGSRIATQCGTIMIQCSSIYLSESFIDTMTMYCYVLLSIALFYITILTIKMATMNKPEQAPIQSTFWKSISIIFTIAVIISIVSFSVYLSRKVIVQAETLV
eukprot:87731_1